jgi:hypothetical protein
MKKLYEGFRDKGTPDMKYYAFDWDDNIVHMPTKIILIDENNKEVGMSTEDFAEFRHIVGKKDFDYKGSIIKGFANNPFRNFRTEGDKEFIVDSLRAKEGPAFKDFKEAINNGSIFAIITARGHNPETIKQTIYNYILVGFGGIEKKELLKNLRKYRNFADEEDMTDDELIKYYLDLNKYNPVSFGDQGAATNPEEAKVMAMDEFVSYVKDMSSILNKKAYIKKDMGGNFVPMIPKIGFSDDDIKNLEVMKKHFKDKQGNLVKTYSTAGGIKKEY